MLSKLRTEEDVGYGVNCELAKQDGMVGGPGAEGSNVPLVHAGLWVRRVELKD